MQHILLTVKPVDFQGWADAVRNYHKDNTLIQNVAAIGTDGMGRKDRPPIKTGFSPQQWAKILNVKMPLDPNTMDTRADHSCSYQKFKGSKGRATTTEDTTQKQCAEGHCFTCNKQGHISRNCLDKTLKVQKKPQTKAKKAETEDSESKDKSNPQPMDLDTYV
jgi:hypothetical protein